MAPRNGGVTNEAVTSARITPENGRSVRATSHPIGAATAQQIAADETAMMNVEVRGSINAASENSRAKLASVSPPFGSVTLKTTSHDSGSTMRMQSRAAKAYSTGAERSMSLAW